MGKGGKGVREARRLGYERAYKQGFEGATNFRDVDRRRMTGVGEAGVCGGCFSVFLSCVGMCFLSNC